MSLSRRLARPAALRDLPQLVDPDAEGPELPARPDPRGRACPSPSCSPRPTSTATCRRWPGAGDSAASRGWRRLGLAVNLVPTTYVGHAVLGGARGPEGHAADQLLQERQHPRRACCIAAFDTDGRESVPHAVGRVSRKRREEGRQGRWSRLQAGRQGGRPRCQERRQGEGQGLQEAAADLLAGRPDRGGPRPSGGAGRRASRRGVRRRRPG